MAELHSALSTLGPTDFSSVPQEPDALTTYLQSAFQSAQIILDSVPPPVPSEVPTTRPRSLTATSEAANSSELLPSTARPEPLDPANVPLQKEWSKPLKLSAKENPMGMSVYKLAGKDGKGAWFARRSVHEGLSFKKWKLGLEREFPETLKVQGGPGEGNIRGIGGERLVEKKCVDGIGALDVYHLTAQFPGPSAPRDFVTLLLTSSNAVSSKEHSKSAPHEYKKVGASNTPNHFMVISRPCNHPECPPRNGFVRGQYESVEFIRQVSRKPTRSASALDLSKPQGPASAASGDEDANRATDNEGVSEDVLNDATKKGRQRGKTISFAANMSDPELAMTKKDDMDELDPVEWIMITRSDPGGSVPRFLVERGTPGSIVADAGKFVDWAAQKEHPEEVIKAFDQENLGKVNSAKHGKLEAVQTNGHLAGLNSVGESAEEVVVEQSGEAQRDKGPSTVEANKSGGLIASMSNAAMSSLENFAPQGIVDRLPGHQPSQEHGITEEARDAPASVKGAAESPSISSASSVLSFASAEDHFDGVSLKSSNESQKSTANMSAHDKELAKLNERKRLLNEKLVKTKEKEAKDKEALTSKEEERIRKAEEKHAKEVAKQEQKYKASVAKLDAKKRKTEEKDEKVRLSREKDELKQQLEKVSKERDNLREQVGALQKENTVLVVRLGKMDDGKEILKEVKAEVFDGNRSRSSSLRRTRPGTPEKGKEATVLAKESPLKENIKP